MFLLPFCNANVPLFDLDLMPYSIFGLSLVISTCVMQMIPPSTI